MAYNILFSPILYYRIAQTPCYIIYIYSRNTIIDQLFFISFLTTAHISYTTIVQTHRFTYNDLGIFEAINHMYKHKHTHM